MEHTKKFVLVDPRFVRPTMRDKVLSGLDTEISNILNSDVSDEIKARATSRPWLVSETIPLRRNAKNLKLPLRPLCRLLPLFRYLRFLRFRLKRRLRQNVHINALASSLKTSPLC